MWRKILLSSSLAIGLMGVGISTVSADMITDTSGLEVNQSTNVGLMYDTVVSDLTPDDYTVTVEKQSDNPAIIKDDLHAATQAGDKTVVGDGQSPYSISVSLTDQGKRKIEQQTGVKITDENYTQVVDLIAAIPSTDGTVTYASTAGSDSDQIPEIKSVGVIVRQNDGSKTVTSQADANAAIVTAGSDQKKAQAKYPISDTTKELLQKGNVGPQRGINVDLNQINRQKQATDMIANKKDRAKVKQQQTKQTAKSIGWQALGIVLLGVLGSFVAWAAYYLTKHRRK